MIISFICGFLFALFLIVFGVFYSLIYVKGKVDDSLRLMLHEKAFLKSITQTTNLDPIRLVSTIQFAFINSYIGTPRIGRLSMIGTTIALYESSDLKFGNVSDKSSFSMEKDHKTPKNKGNSPSIPFFSSFSSSSSASDQLIGKISTVSLEAKCMLIEKEKNYKSSPFTGLVLILRRRAPDLGNFSNKGKLENITEPSDKSDFLSRPPLFIPNTVSIGLKEHYLNTRNEDLPDTWRSIMIQFSTIRELERWVTVLNPSSQTHLWRLYMKTLPNLDVFNVFASRIFFENKKSDEFKEIVIAKINKKLKKVNLPKGIFGSIRVHDLHTGSELPLISNVSNLMTNANGEICFNFDLWYRGGFILQLRLAFTIRTTRIPDIIISITVKELKGKLHVSIGSPPSNRMWLAFQESPYISLDFKPRLAEGESGLLSTVISLLPNLSDLVTSIIRVHLLDDMTLPSMDDFPLPNVKDTPPNSPCDSNLKQLIGHDNFLDTDILPFSDNFHSSSPIATSHLSNNTNNNNCRKLSLSSSSPTITASMAHKPIYNHSISSNNT